MVPVRLNLRLENSGSTPANHHILVPKAGESTNPSPHAVPELQLSYVIIMVNVMTHPCRGYL